MSRSTEDLIAALAADVRPVRRLAPPMARAGGWLLAVCAAAWVLVQGFADLEAFATRAADLRLAAELAATLATGVAAVIAAFHLCLPDRPRAWALLPLPPLAVWLGLSGLGCWNAFVVEGPLGPEPGRSLDCLLFILAASLPLGAALVYALAKAKPLEPTSTAAVAGLGVAALSAFLLQFFHPFETTAMDLAVHVLAVLAVVAAASIGGRRIAG